MVIGFVGEQEMEKNDIGSSIRPLYDSVVEAASEPNKNWFVLDGLIDSYNRIYEVGYKDRGIDYFKNARKIEKLSEELQGNVRNISSKFAELELNLTIMHGSIYHTSIERKPAQKGIMVNQNSVQTQKISNTSITNIDQAIEILNELTIQNEVKEEAKQNLSLLREELKKTKPSSDVLRKILEWSSTFEKYTGINLSSMIIKLLLEHWDKIVVLPK